MASTANAIIGGGDRANNHGLPATSITLGVDNSSPSPTATEQLPRLISGTTNTTKGLLSHFQRDRLLFCHLEKCIEEEFGAESTVAGITGTSTATLTGTSTLETGASLRTIMKQRTLWGRFKAFSKRTIENNAVITFFMSLTLYALFVPDVDQLFGDKLSALLFSIATTVIFVLFAFELGLTSAGKPGYVLSTYFWLDIVALLSLIPDTYFVQVMMTDSAFAAGRTSRLMRLIRLTARSSKVTRLNRLTRIIRVASLMPRMAALCGRRVGTDDAQKLLDKKLRRIFAFIDDDNDGHILYYQAKMFVECTKNLGKVRKNDMDVKGVRRPSIDASMGVDTAMAMGIEGSLGTEAEFLASPSMGGSPTSMYARYNAAPGSETIQPLDLLASDSSPQTNKTTSLTTEPSLLVAAEPHLSLPQRPSVAESMGTRHSSDGGDAGVFVSENQGGAGNDEDKRQVRFDVNATESDKRREKEKGGVTWSVTATQIGAQRGQLQNRGRAAVTTVMSDTDPEARINIEEFMAIVAKGATVQSRLFKSCKRQLRHSDSMSNQTSKHSEAVGVRVALGVLLLLFILQLVDLRPEDISSEWCLGQIDNVAVEMSSTWNGTFIPEYIQSQVRVWARGVKREASEQDRRDIIYLSLNRLVYCNEFVSHGQRCNGGQADNMHWTPRSSLDSVLQMYRKSDFRIKDLDVIYVPAETEDPTAFVVLNNRSKVQQDALISIGTTLVVVVIILGGISLLTQDFTSLTKTLLNPLKELADEMQSIANLQLAGVSDETPVIYKGTSEIRNIRRAFENMKKAIKSWGKYVPWPVVQIMLQANVEDAEHLIEEREVTVFFSDIAGFTTIVETLPPERSLLLLTRYFNDMSKAIDEYDGVIIEYIGDAILSIYGAPLKNPAHPTNGVKSTLRMLSMLKKLNEWGKNQGLPEVSIRCGLHTGLMTLGNLGFRYRMKYGIVGEETSIPGKLEEMNKTYGTSFLVSEGTFEKMQIDAFIYRPIDYVYLYTSPEKRHRCELVYNILDRVNARRPKKQERLQAACSTHEEAIDRYVNRQFIEAAALFEKAGQLMQNYTGAEDKASAVMLERCRAYIEQPPPENWKGAWEGG